MIALIKVLFIKRGSIMILRSRLNQVKIHSQKLQREYLESKKLLTRTLTIIIQDEQELKVSSILLNMTDISLN